MNKGKVSVNFENYIRREMEHSSFAAEYLKSGLSSDLNLGGRLTPEIFSTFFLVREQNRELGKIHEIIQSLFESETNNMLCLESNRGNGKSTFVNTMQLKTSKTYFYEYPYPCIDLTKKYTIQILRAFDI